MTHEPGDDAVAELRKQLRGTLPASVEDLEPDAIWDLAGAVRTARRRQTEHLIQATEASLSHVPRLVRPVVRKVIGL
ncbi:hypothetical protein [Actinokineospora sp. HUAS TT18]|uniref:hypothetical protein n=1 Tax=Actinokineospora sp. HUAS TT18 TaxID=3447451 RepID=UPI003F528C7A